MPRGEAAAAWQADVTGQRCTEQRRHKGVNRGTHSNKHMAAGIAGTALLRNMQYIHRSTPGRASKSTYSSRLLQVTTTLALSLSLSAAAAVRGGLVTASCAPDSLRNNSQHQHAEWHDRIDNPPTDASCLPQNISMQAAPH